MGVETKQSHHVPRINGVSLYDQGVTFLDENLGILNRGTSKVDSIWNVYLFYINVKVRCVQFNTTIRSFTTL